MGESSFFYPRLFLVPPLGEVDLYMSITICREKLKKVKSDGEGKIRVQ